MRSWNAGAERIKGYSAREAIGMHFSAFYRADDRGWADLLERARTQGRAHADGWRVRKDGTQFWASVVITALHDPESGELIGFAKVTRDLTDRAYRAFVEATNAIVWTTDPSGHPNTDSASWRAFTGQSEAEWLGRQGWDAVHPDDREGLRAAWAAATVSGKPFFVEMRLRRHDGVYVWMASRAVAFRASDGSVREWFGVSFDISARKAAEEEVLRARRWLETTLRSIGDGVIATDIRGAVTFMNPIAEQITGWSSTEANGRSLHEVFPIVNEESRETVENPVDRVLREGVIVGLANHTVLLRRDGSEVPIDDSAAPIRGDRGLEGVVLVFRDASHEKLLIARREFLAKAGHELTAASDYRDALATIARLAVPRLADWCAVDVVDPNDGEVERLAVAHVDPAKVELAHDLQKRYPPDPNAPTGVPNVVRTGRSELYREIPRELIDAVAVDEEHRAILHALNLRSGMVVAMRGRERVFGAITFVHTGNRRYTDDDLAFAEDFAQRAAMLVERRRLEEEARQASRTKDQFLAMLGHELRNPLAPIRTALEVMELSGDGGSQREREVIARQVEHLVRLVDDLLDVSRITQGKIVLARERVEIARVVEHALEMTSPLIEARGHHLELEVPQTGLAVSADRARLAQVVSNLLTNAAKFTDQGGRITVRAAREGADVVLSVSDTGIGIEPAKLRAVFDMFVQAQEPSARGQSGLGLGLTIAQSLTRMHGGTLSAKSEGLGRGTTFTLKLPAATAETPERATPGPMKARGRTGRRVLLVDDNEDAIALLEMALVRIGYEVKVALDAPAALEVTKTFVPEVAVLDIGLPVMDGYELAKRLRERFPKLPMIAVTGYGREKDQARAKEAGFDRHLLKPVSLPDLRAAIEEALG